VTAPRAIDLPAAASPEAVAALDRMLRALQAALRLPPAWTPSLEARIDEAFAAYDDYLAIVTAAHPMTCRAGCTACCHDTPRGVSGLELLWLGALVDRLDRGPEIRRRFAELSAETTSPEAWRARRVPCPLLQDGRCSAYSRRPIACRAFYALTPPSWCSPDDPRYADRLNPHLDPPAILVAFFRALSERMGLATSIDLHAGLARRP
jgi:Fe-S-cluster containining protein